jgi:hypothetical protein
VRATGRDGTGRLAAARTRADDDSADGAGASTAESTRRRGDDRERAREADPGAGEEQAGPRRVLADRPADRPRGRGWFRRRAVPQDPPPEPPEQHGPRTVGELVALRAQEAGERDGTVRRDRPS